MAAKMSRASDEQAGTASSVARPNPLPDLLTHDTSGAADFCEADGLYQRHLAFDNIKEAVAIGPREHFEAAARSIRDLLSQRWVATGQTYERQNPKRIYYLSMEFLLGRSLANNVTNLMLDSLMKQTAASQKVDWLEILEQEPDAGLGNGGLGRLAACFLDSMATMELPAMGYGLRYEYGMFKQSLHGGWQVEHPDNWLKSPDPWEIARPHEKVGVRLNCSFELRGGTLRAILGRASSLVGVPYDRPIVGYGGRTINTLRLWAATAPDYFDFKVFSHGDFVSAVAETLTAESLTRVLYPDDSTSMGQGLRFVQEYFLVACSLADLIRRFHHGNSDWSRLPERVAIQLNDTHPALAVAELMRILLDEAQLAWDTAWDITCRTLAYTNHTLLPEALERWPVAWFEMLLPRHLQIIYEINRRLLEAVRARYPGDDARVARVSLIEEGADRKVRMANLAIVGSHSTNGVAAIHSDLLRKTTVRDLAEVFPERFSNKTNGVTPRRWLLLANPALARTIAEVIGDAWITDLTLLQGLRDQAGSTQLQENFRRAKREAKVRFADWLRGATGQIVDVDSIFDCQIKRIHEYKRQLLNALRIMVLYHRVRENPQLEMVPRTFFFAGKAAPAYHLAKVIIKLITNLANAIDHDPLVKNRIKVHFLPDYCATLAERLIPASDVSNQISTAGYEASGTSNMKFMMNGALTVGTRDGATIEMAEEAGEENFFLFGLTASQVAESRGWYNPYWHYQNEPEARSALDAIRSGHFDGKGPAGVFTLIWDTLITHGDFYMHLADLRSYLEADERLVRLYAQPKDWTRMTILNVANSGKFSSDRTIAEYSNEIWKTKSCPVSWPSPPPSLSRPAGEKVAGCA
jgi:starch phosphorylase